MAARRAPRPTAACAPTRCPAGKAWQGQATGKTDANGAYALTATGQLAANGEPVYAMLDADGSCAAHYNYLFAPGTKVVVADIDGTLTTDNNQIIMQLTDETYVPKMMVAANALTTEWVKKGYPVIYLSARIHAYRPESRSWLASQGFARGALITENGGEKADVYKTLWLSRMKQTFGWDIVAAYGNEQTDLDAYHNVGIPAAQTFIIGPLGDAPTTPASTSIPGLDYTAHITSYVDAQPDVSPAPPGTGPDAAKLR
jgi:phosphatidate phosphatase PAH1